jgi:hypothetical protein
LLDPDLGRGHDVGNQTRGWEADGFNSGCESLRKPVTPLFFICKKGITNPNPKYCREGQMDPIPTERIPYSPLVPEKKPSKYLWVN